MSSELARAYRRFWLSFEVSDTKLRLFRFLFFGILALDAWKQLPHAPRYGAGDFNVSHIPALDGFLPVPTPEIMAVLYLVMAVLAARVALGANSRPALAGIAAVWGVTYFWSQLDSYQHHYLIFLVLVITVFLPWPSLRDDPDPPKQRRSWAMRLLLVQFSVLYFFAVIAKLDGAWLDGTTLSTQIQPGIARDIADGIGWSKAAKLVIVAELFLAVAIQWRKLWPAALVVGLGLHASIELGGFKIGLFSYFMFGVYVLVVPDGWLERASNAITRRLPRTSLQSLREWFDRPKVARVSAGGGLIVGSALLLLLPFDVTGRVISILVPFVIVDAAFRGPARSGLVHVLAAVTLLVFSFTTDVARDHYRYLGGTNRRLGDLDAAIAAYQRVVEIDPEWSPGHNSLGNLYRRTERWDEALDEYDAAVRFDPIDWRPYVGIALVRHELGQGERALAAAERAMALIPEGKNPGEERMLQSNRDRMRRLRDHWRRQLK